MAMKLPTLSVVVPNYNHAKYLPTCLESILKQSVPPQEIIVIDDGSTDNSLEIFEGFARKHSQIKIHRNEVNRGALYTINRGVDLATGELICMWGADDEMLPGFLEQSLRLFAQHPSAGLSATICRMSDVNKGLVYYFGYGIADRPCYLSPQDVVELCREGRFLVFTASTIYRRQALLEAGKYQQDLRWHSDWLAMYTSAFRYGMCFVPEVLSEFRILPGGFSGKGMRNPTEQRAVLRHLLEMLDRKEYADVVPLMRDGLALAPFGKTMLWMLLSDKRYRKYVTLAYLRRAIWWTLRIEAKKILPRSVTALYFRLTGYSKGPTTDGSGERTAPVRP